MDDSERVLTDALRRQATSTNAGMTPVQPAPAPRTDRMPVLWVLVLALLLGLAAGTVAAVITLS
ncbi:hypothetical protein FKR81_08025 [Lentzea tibetensis]|uniref:Uncharacterized protein n=1 Tax=Lentzea tibetensis TaxID=2591470 RepID=A0A563EZD3_9PSEU|nr:hypothetical protein [Lentzea tibetensis]TWP53029.1 hypothetical protein FKR81_08025 [Lentzea tibetensis]